MILAQAVLEILCSPRAYRLTLGKSKKKKNIEKKMAKSEKEIIQSNIYRILPKVNQVIYFLNTVYQSTGQIS